MFRQGTRFRHVSALAVAAVLGACASARPAPPPKGLWATVNTCDPTTWPDSLGVRARMPGGGKRQRLFMRFHAQAYKADKKIWTNVRGAAGVSGWQSLGKAAKGKPVQAGWTFQFQAPTAGTSYVLRGVVDFQWREKRRT